jgi:hypothetical protein
MLGLSLTTVSLFCAFVVFIFYVQKHATTFQGASQGYGAALTIVGLAGLIAQLGFYCATWWFHGFWAALTLFGISVFAALLFTFLEVLLRVPLYLLSMIGLVAAPVLCALAWWSLLAQRSN